MKRRFRNLPIKHKLMALTVGISGVALLIACAAFALYEQAAFRRGMARDFAILADMFDDNVASGLAFNDPAAIEQTLKTLSAHQRIVAACVYNKEGAVIGTYRRPGSGGDGFAFPPAQPTSQRFGAERLDTFKDIDLAGERIGVVYIGVDLSELRERAWRYAIIVGLLLAGCSLVALVLAARLQRIISQPIEDLAQTVAAVALGKNYAVRAPKQGDDELGRLIDGFNEMLGQIQARDSALHTARDQLEHRVEERTAALQRENAERRLAEEELRASNEKFHQLADNITDAFWIRSPDMSEVHYVSPAFERIWGRSVASLYADPHQWSEFIVPEDRQRVQDAFAQLTGDGPSLEIEYRIARPDGEVRWVRVRGFQVRDATAKLIRHTGIVTDITSWKQTEAALARAHQELVDTSHQAGMAEVATGVLHNVGNVLNSVNVSATLIADRVHHTQAANIAKLAALFAGHKADLASFLTTDPRGLLLPDYLGTLAESIAAEQTAQTTELEHLRKNIDHIKDIVAMQQAYARTSGAVETVAVADLIEDALRINAGSLDRQDVTTSRDYQVRPVVTTDRRKVMQILVNLVRNAMDACEESGRPDKRLTVRTTSDDRNIQIAVSDNGVGIPAGNLLRIFNHGFTTRKDGHGFGLHSSALAARELGGSLSVSSDGPGQGAAFTLNLPLAHVLPAAHTNSRASNPAGGGQR